VKTVEARIDKVDHNIYEDNVPGLIPEAPASYHVANLSDDFSKIEVKEKKMDLARPSVGEVVLDQVQDGLHDHEIDSVSLQKENVSASDSRLSPVPLDKCNKFADEDTPSIATDQNKAYGIDTGSFLDPRTKDNKSSEKYKNCVGKEGTKEAAEHPPVEKREFFVLIFGSKSSN
ncbi:hypothetical protein Tco_0092175, partial [Tanacetum coccineum]